MSERNLRRAIDAMLRDRRVPAGPLSEDEGRALRAAARLRAARPDAASPRPEFVDALGRRLRDRPAATSRRRFLQGAGIAAAAAAAGVAADRVLDATVFSATPAAPPPTSLVPVSGSWQPVTTLTVLRSTPVVSFTAGAVPGFVIRVGDTVRALSAVCTHQGCLLGVSPDRSRLVCPCHRQTFELDGAPSPGDYRLAPLPALPHRIVGDAVEVFVAT
jgi:cytochrome b6-f complex iron-sulfur subunit